MVAVVKSKLANTGDSLDTEGLELYMTDVINSRKKVKHVGGRVEDVFATSEYDYGDQVLGTDTINNSVIMDAAATGYRDEQQALVAAGAPCAPLMPTYNFTNCYKPQRPVEAGIQVIGANRGGIKFLKQVPLGGEAAAAITIKDAAASAILPGQPGYQQKNCTRVSCPTEDDVTVGSISKCVTFDNLNFRVFPEQVRDMLRRVQIEFAKAKEVFYLNRLDQFASNVDIPASQANPYGSGRSFFGDLMASSHNYRKRNNMDIDDLLDVWVPTVVEPNLAIDMTNDPNMSALGTIQSGPGGNLAQVLAQRARLNVMYYYYDATEAGFPNSGHNQAAGAWNPIPKNIRTYMYAPGAVVRLDGGTLDLGIVRDSVLNGDNDLQMFSEQWIEMANPGCEVISHDHQLCYSGVGPQHVPALTCP